MGNRLVRAAAALIADTSWSADGRKELYHALEEELGEVEFKRVLDEYERPILERRLTAAVGMLRSWGYTVEPPPKGGSDV